MPSPDRKPDASVRPRGPRLLHTSRVETTSTRFAPASRVDPSGLDQVQPMSRTAEVGWVLITCSPTRNPFQGGGPSPSNDVPDTDLLLCVWEQIRRKYDVFPIMPGSSDTWCLRTGRDWVGVWDLQNLQTLPKRLSVRGLRRRVRQPVVLPTRRGPGEACISTDLITLAGRRAPSSCGSDKNFISLAQPWVPISLAVARTFGGWTDQIKILVWVAARARPFPNATAEAKHF